MAGQARIEIPLLDDFEFIISSLARSKDSLINNLQDEEGRLNFLLLLAGRLFLLLVGVAASSARHGELID